MAESPRKFVSLCITYVTYREEVRHGTPNRDISQVLAAVADDGTAWVSGVIVNGTPVYGWLRVHDLPPRVDTDA